MRRAIADALTPEERAAIAAYSGPVTPCEPGLSAGDGSLPMRAQVRAQWAVAKARKLMLPKIREAEAEAVETHEPMPMTDAIRILEAVDD